MSAAKKKTTTKKDTDLVFGFGVTGLSVARYLKRHERTAVYYDSREEPPGLEELEELDADAEIVYGKKPNGILKKAGRVIVSPGIPDSDDLLVEARKKKLGIVSDIELFVEEAKAPIAAITGSNGKSTVATLLAMMCRAAGRNVQAGANLGTPALDLLDAETPDAYILELSSFQLQRVPKLPTKVSVLLNISPDHLDWHADEDEYREAKYRILAEAESAVVNRADEEVFERLGKKQTHISFGLDEPAEGQYGIREEDGVQFLARGEQFLLAVDDLALVGRHNQANALAAMAAGQLLGLDLPSMLQVLAEFPGLPHRMQRVATFEGVHYINDSKATNVGAAVASVDSLDGFVVLIAGGQGKGGDFDSLARAVHHRLRCAVLMGEDGAQIAEAFEDLAPTYKVETMHDAIMIARQMAEAGETVLLAPACASFDMYPNYQARGDDFVAEVGALTG